MRAAQSLVYIVVVQLEEQGISHIHAQGVDVGKVLAQFSVLFCTQHHTNKVLGVAVYIGDECLDRACLGGRLICLERFVHLPDVGNAAGLDRQVVTHEAVKQLAVVLLPKALLHGVPVVVVECLLLRWLLAHQDIVADQVGLAQLQARRVEALKDQLRVVIVAVQRDVDDDQLADTSVQRH